MSIDTPVFPAGWKVFPVHADAKEPIFKGFLEAATDDTAKIAQWAEEYPGCNWGLATGASGLAVVDIDPPTGEESLFQFELDHDFLPATREHRSARGGRHLIFTGDCVPSASKIGQKLDTRGRGSYILIPPSTFEGKPYELTEDRPLAPLPQFVSDAAGAKKQRVEAGDALVLDSDLSRCRAKKLLADYCDAGHVAVEGQGGDALTYAVAAEVINLGLSPDVALEIMADWNDACSPPWQEDDLRIKIENAATYAQNDAGAWYVPPVQERIPQAALDKLIAESAAQPVARPEREERGRFNWMGEAEFTTMPPPVWLLEDIFTTESIAMLYGPSGHYKSFLALNLGAQVARQGKCAFYVASEGITRMARMDFPAWKLAYGQDDTIPFFMQEEMPQAAEATDFTEFARSIERKAAGRPVGIIFLDTLNTALIGLEENSSGDTAKLMQAMKFLKKTFRCTVVAIHHTPKDGSEPRGSSALYAGMDTVLKVISNQDVKLAKMFVTKQKTAEPRKYPFCFEGKRVGPGLAFTPIDAREAAVLSDETDVFSPKNISAALVKLKAFDPVKVSSHVLLSHIIPQLENETLEARSTSLMRASKGLAAAIKHGKLEGYHEGFGRGVMWSLPTPQDPT